MALYQLNNQVAALIKPTDVALEKDIQRLVEKNLQPIFNCRFIATEFPTGSIHSGRIDTLALSEDNNPVIIEYKKVASSELINQSLFYLHWMRDHKGDFQVAVHKSLGAGVEVDWSEIRVICLAPEYKKYDLHAVQVMGANIELWQFRLYENDILQIEEVYRKSETSASNHSDPTNKNPVMVEAGKKAAQTRKTGVYTIEEHKDKLSYDLKGLFDEIREYIVNLSTSVEETPKRYYISYKISQNFVCLVTKGSRIDLYLKINPHDIQPLPPQCRDMRNIGHFGTGDLQLSITSSSDFQNNRNLINESLKNIGG